MGAIEIERQHPAEHGLYWDQYEGLARELENAGYSVTVFDKIEERDASSIIEGAAAVITLAQAAGLDEATKAVLRNLKGRLRRKQRIVEIRDSQGNLLSKVNVPDE
jgi:hypothetical protein